MMSMFLDYESLKPVIDFASSLIGKINDGEYVKAIKDLHGNELSRTCVDAQIDLIKNDSKLSTEEKLYLMSVAEAQHNARVIEQKIQCGQVIDRGRDNKSLSVFRVFTGILSAGYVTYAIASKIQNCTGIPYTTRLNN